MHLERHLVAFGFRVSILGFLVSSFVFLVLGFSFWDKGIGGTSSVSAWLSSLSSEYQMERQNNTDKYDGSGAEMLILHD